MADKITCGSCSNIMRRKYCVVKDIAVSRTKVHDCDQYEMKAPKSNLIPTYVPADAKDKRKQLRRLLRKMNEAGATLTEDGTIVFNDIKVTPDGQVYRRQEIQIPKTTANASVVGLEGTDNPQMSDNRDPVSE